MSTHQSPSSPSPLDGQRPLPLPNAEQRAATRDRSTRRVGKVRAVIAGGAVLTSLAGAGAIVVASQSGSSADSASSTSAGSTTSSSSDSGSSTSSTLVTSGSGSTSNASSGGS